MFCSGEPFVSLASFAEPLGMDFPLLLLVPHSSTRASETADTSAIRPYGSVPGEITKFGVLGKTTLRRTSDGPIVCVGSMVQERYTPCLQA